MLTSRLGEVVLDKPAEIIFETVKSLGRGGLVGASGFFASLELAIAFQFVHTSDNRDKHSVTHKKNRSFFDHYDDAIAPLKWKQEKKFASLGR